MPATARARKDGSRETKEQRLQLRVTPDLKRQLAEAARSRGLSMSDFAIHAISEAVSKANYERRVIEMSDEESAWLAELLVNPPAPNDRLTATVARYTQLVRP